MITNFVARFAHRTVMAGRVPAICTGTGAATDGRDTPGHDGEGTVLKTELFSSHALILMRMGRVPVIRTTTDAATDGQDNPGHDVRNER